MEELLATYEFDTLEEFAGYIVESYLNGQKKQARELYQEVKPYRKEEEVGHEIVRQSSDHELTVKILKHIGYGWSSDRKGFYDKRSIENIFHDQGMEIPKV
jgi:hypothetical protein